jgi:hypothetical protein
VFTETGLAGAAGLGVGLLITVTLLTLVWRDNAAARFVQHGLVGAALGYVVVITWRQVIEPRLLAPLLRTPGDVLLWAPLLLSAVLWAAGVERLWRRANPADGTPGPVRRGVRRAGSAVAALLLAGAVAIAVVGMVQGTLVPQVMRAARMGFDPALAPPLLLTGLLTLLITVGVLLHLYTGGDRFFGQAPPPIRQLMAAWLWLGKRAIWLAAGVLFARLFASRVTLLSARFEYLVVGFQQTGIWQWLTQIWNGLP